MNKNLVTLCFAGVLLFSTDRLNSQGELPADGKSVLLSLQTLKQGNQLLIEKQKATLQTLDELQLTAEQIKTFGKRG